jgi:hypothetical protein
MKTNFKTFSAIAIAALLAGCSTGEKKTETDKDVSKQKVEIQTYKNTTEIPSNITTPDEVETSIGTLHFFDGVPTKETAQLTQDFLLKARGVDAFLKGIPGASLQALRKGPAAIGVDAVGKVALFEKLMDSHALFLTANTSTLYIFPYVNTTDGAVVVEVPPMMLGAFDDAWFRFVSDVGLAGPDRGKGGKYLVLPPGYKGKIPAGYFVIKPRTYATWLFMRGNISKGIDVSVKKVKDHLKVYPLSEAANPKPVEYVNMTGKSFNTIHPNNFEFYVHLNELIQEESDEMLDDETKGLFASIGIKKGEKFNPTAREKRILTDAVAIANAAARSNNYYPTGDLKMVYFYKDVPTEWVMAYPDKNVYFNYEHGFNTDARVFFHYTYTAVTPSMATPHEGKGSDYCIAFKDSKHEVFDGSKTYKVRLPPNVPVADFWALTIYDSQTRSMLQTDQPYPTVGSNDNGFKQNEDGSYDVYFGPKPPKGFENNWLQTIPGKSWFVILRMYGPLKPFIEKTWRPGEIELVK